MVFKSNDASKLEKAQSGKAPYKCGGDTFSNRVHINIFVLMAVLILIVKIKNNLILRKFIS